VGGFGREIATRSVRRRHVRHGSISQGSDVGMFVVGACHTVAVISTCSGAQ
jgi:hypothetical protein